MISAKCRAFDETSRGVLADGLEAWSAWVAQLTDAEDCIAAMLHHAYSVGDWESFSLYVLAATHRPSTLYTHDLCMVLGQRIEDADNEGIVEALAEIRDPAAVPALEGALWWERDWDEYRALAIKVIWALTAIGTPEAIDVLRDAATTADERTRLFAASALKRFSR